MRSRQRTTFLFTLCGCTRTMSSFISPNIRLHPLQDRAASGLVGHQSGNVTSRNQTWNCWQTQNRQGPDSSCSTDSTLEGRRNADDCPSYNTVWQTSSHAHGELICTLLEKWLPRDIRPPFHHFKYFDQVAAISSLLLSEHLILLQIIHMYILMC